MWSEKAEKNIQQLQHLLQQPQQPINELQNLAGVLGQCMGAIGIHPTMVAQYSVLLQKAIPVLLNLCSHESAEVRLVGDEALNRVVVGGSPFHASKVHLHLHNLLSISKNPKWIRACLSRICLGSSWLRAGAGRGRLFAHNTIPKLKDIIEKMKDPAIIEEKGDLLLIECLESNLPRIISALSPYCTKDELFSLMIAFFQFVDSPNAPIRRGAANCIADLCQYHQKKSIPHAINTSLDNLNVDSSKQTLLIGWFNTLRAIFLINTPENIQKDILPVEKFVQIYHACLYQIESNMDHNIQNSSMELLNILLTNPRDDFKKLLLDPNGCSSIILAGRDKIRRHCRSQSTISMAQSIMSRTSSHMNLSEDLLLSEHSEAPGFRGSLLLGSISQYQTPHRSLEDLSMKGLITSDSLHDSVISETNREAITSEQLASYVNEKFDVKNFEKDNTDLNDVTSGIEDLADETQSEYSYRNALKVNIGNFYECEIPLKYCARLLTSRFLLTGISGSTISDRSIRVSVKSLAISCLSSITLLYPEILTLYLDKDVEISVHNNSGNSEFSNRSHSDAPNDFVLERNICYQESLTESFAQDLLCKSIDMLSQASGIGSQHSKHSSSAMMKRDKSKTNMQESMDNSSSLAGIPSNILDKQSSQQNQNQMATSFMSTDSINVAMTGSNFTMGSNMTASNDPLSTDLLMTTSIDPLSSSLDLEIKFDHFGDVTGTTGNFTQQTTEVFYDKKNENDPSQTKLSNTPEQKVRKDILKKHSSEKSEKVLETVDENITTEDEPMPDAPDIVDENKEYIENKSVFQSSQNLQEEFQPQHMNEIIYLFENHSDPQIRGIIRILVGNFLKAALNAALGDISKWKPIKVLPKLLFDKLQIPILMNLLVKGLNDKIHSCVNNSLNALSICLEAVSLSIDNSILHTIFNQLRCVENNQYWLCKVNLCNLYKKLPFDILAICIDDWSVRSKMILEIVIIMLGDQDHRVRKAATEAIVQFSNGLIPNSKNVLNVELKNLADKSTREFLFVDSTKKVDIFNDLKNSFVLSDFPGCLKELPENNVIENIDSIDKLKYIITNISFKLLKSRCKYFSQGCLESLLELAKVYPTMKYKNSYCSLGLLDFCLQLLETRTISVVFCDTIISFITQIYAVEAWDAMQLVTSDNKYDNTPSLRSIETMRAEANQHPPWSHFGSGNFNSKAELFLKVTLKLLNIIVHILEDIIPIMFHQRNSLVPSSPIRKKQGEMKRPSHATSMDSSISDEKHSFKKKAPFNSTTGQFMPLGYFANDIIFMKLYANLSAAYSSHKLSLDATNSVFLKFVTTVLESLTIQLEFMTEIESGKIAEEILFYVGIILPIKPDTAVGCVTQVLKSLSATNITAYRNDLKCFFKRPEKNPHKTNNSFYHDIVMVNYFENNESYDNKTSRRDSMDSRKSINSLGHASLDTERKNYESIKSFTQCKTDKKWSTSKSELAKYLRLIEPVVIQALKSYTVQNNGLLQCRVLDLLNQLLMLRVNYCLLDSDQVFIGFVLKQLENIEHLEILHCDELVHCIFKFLVHLSSTKHHTKQLMDVPKLMQLCDGLMASGVHSECVESLHPVVYKVFTMQRQQVMQATPIGRLQAQEAQATREVLFAMMQKMMHNTKIIKLISCILVCAEDQPQAHFRWSELACDSIIQLLKQRCIDFSNNESFSSIEKLFDCIHRDVLFDQSKLEAILKIMFDKPPDQIHSSIQEKERWLGTILLFLRKIICHVAENEILLSLEYLKTSHISPSSIFFNVQNEIDPLNVQNVNENCANLSGDVIFIRFLFKTITYAITELEQSEVSNIDKNPYWSSLITTFICQTKHILHFKEGCKFPLLAKTAQNVLLNEHSGLNTGLYSPEENIPLDKLTLICSHFSWKMPLLSMHWYHLLIRLKFLEQKYWNTLFRGLQSTCSFSEVNPKRNINDEIVQIGCFLALCEYFIDNGLDEVYYLTWLLVNRIHLFVRFFDEDLVQKLLNKINENDSASGLLLQAIAARCQPCLKGSFGMKALKIVSKCHDNQSGSLILFICHNIGNLNLANSFAYAELAIKRCQFLLNVGQDEITSQLSKEDLQYALETLQKEQIFIRHPSLIKNINMLASTFFDLSPLDLSHDRPVNPKYIKNTSLNEEWLTNQLKNKCYQNMNEIHPSRKYKSIAKILTSFTSDQLEIIFGPEFDLQIICQTMPMAADVFMKELVHSLETKFGQLVESRNEKMKMKLEKLIEIVSKEMNTNDLNLFNLANNLVKFKKPESQSQFYIPVKEDSDIPQPISEANALPSIFGKLKIEIEEDKSEIVIPEINPLLEKSLAIFKQVIDGIISLFPKQSRPLSEFDPSIENHTLDKYTRRCFQVFRGLLFHQDLMNIQYLITSYLNCVEKIETTLKMADYNTSEKVLEIFIPKTLAKSLMSYTIISLQYVSYLILLNSNEVKNVDEFSIRNSIPLSSFNIDQTINTCIINASKLFQIIPIWQELNAESNTNRVQSAINCLYTFVRYTTKDTCPLVLENFIFLDEDNSEIKKHHDESISVCNRLLTLINFWANNLSNNFKPNPCDIMSSQIQTAVKKLLIALCRCNYMNSYALIPPLACGQVDLFDDMAAKLVTDKKDSSVPNLTLKKKIEIPIMALQDMDVLEQFLFRINFIGWTDKKNFEEIWMSLLGALQGNGTHWALRGMMQLLLTVNQVDCPRAATIANYKYKKLIDTSMNCDLYSSIFHNENLESLYTKNSYDYSKLSINYLRYAIGVGEDDDEYDVRVHLSSQTSKKILHNSGIDLNSCLQLLMDISVQMQSTWGLGARNTLLCCLINVSDTFSMTNQWQWLRDQLNSVAMTSDNLDLLTYQYLTVGIAKVNCVLDDDMQDLNALSSAFSSSYAPLRIAAYHAALMYLSGSKEEKILQKDSPLLAAKLNLEVSLLSVIQSKLTTSSKVSRYEQALCWSALFLLVERGHTNLLTNVVDFILKNSNHFCMPLILKGLCRAILSEGKSPSSDTQSSVLKIINGKPEMCHKLLPILLVLVYCGDSSSKEILEPEQLLGHLQTAATLQNSVIYSNLSACRQVTSALSNCLHDFLPAAAVLNKVIQEFLDCVRWAETCSFKENAAYTKSDKGLNLTPYYAETMAEVVFNVFGTAIEQSQLTILSGWLFDVLVNLFREKISQGSTPLCLLSLIVSSSSNTNLRSISPLLFNSLKNVFENNFRNKLENNPKPGVKIIDSQYEKNAMINFSDRKILCLAVMHSDFNQTQKDKLKTLCIGNPLLKDLMLCLDYKDSE